MRRLRCMFVCWLALFAAVLPTPMRAATGVSLSPEEERLLAAAIYTLSQDSALSAEPLPFAAQVALSAVALRRYANGHCGGTMAEVLAGMDLLPHEQIRATDLDARWPTALRAVHAALAGADPTCGAWIAVLPDSRGASSPDNGQPPCFSCGGICFYDTSAPYAQKNDV